jgi:transcription initiation factor TFIIB
MVGAVVYAACRIQNIPRRLSAVASKVGISEKKLGRCYRQLKFGLKLQVPIPDPVIIVPRIIQRIGSTEAVQNRAIEILRSAKENDLYAGRDPWGLAASAIYLASIAVGPRINQIAVADAAGVTEVTVRNRAKELREVLDSSIWSDGSSKLEDNL